MRSREQKEEEKEESSSSSSTDKVDSLLRDVLDQLEHWAKTSPRGAELEEEEKEATPSESGSGRFGETSNEVSPFENGFARSRLNISERKDPSKSTSIFDRKRPSNVQYLEKSIFS